MDKVKFVTRTAVLLALTVVFQSLKLGQLVTGSLVNAILFISACMIGWSSGALIGSITPLVALLIGILKPALAPAVPFIMLGNAILVLVFCSLKDKNFLVAVVVASCAKFLVLYISTRFLISLNPVIVTALQFPQLLTAFIGGSVALIITSILK